MRTLILLILCSGTCMAQEFWFWPKYTLGQKAENYPGPRIDSPVTPNVTFKSETTSIVFHGEEPTQRINDFVKAESIPKKKFSAELWLVNHVNQPVGMIVTVKRKFGGSEPLWLLGAYQRNIVFSLKPDGATFSKLLTHDLIKRGWKNYWLHIVAVSDGQTMRLYVNGEKVGEQNATPMEAFDVSDVEIEAAAYTTKEPYMAIGNLMKMFHLYDRNVDDQFIRDRFKYLQSLVNDGKLYPDLFHFAWAQTYRTQL